MTKIRAPIETGSVKNFRVVMISVIIMIFLTVTFSSLSTDILVLTVIASVAGVYIVAACRQHRYLKRKTNQLRLSPLQVSPGIHYSIPPTEGAKARLLDATSSDDEYDDADGTDEVLKVISQR